MKLKLFNHTGIAGGLLIYLALLDKSSSKEITKKAGAEFEKNRIPHLQPIRSVEPIAYAADEDTTSPLHRRCSFRH